MRLQSLGLVLSLALPASVALGVTQVAAQQAHAGMKMPTSAPTSAAGQSRWSVPRSWPDGKVPRAGDAVTIGKDRNIVLDVSPPALRSLTIEGKRSFSNDRDLELKTDS